MGKPPTHDGSCHCGRVRFRVTAPLDKVVMCNCSICTKKAYLHWIVARERFRLLTPWEELATYRFNTGVAQHHFCKTCDIASFYIPRSDPDKIDVNLRCVEGVDPAALQVVPFDGRNWERAQGRSKP